MTEFRHSHTQPDGERMLGRYMYLSLLYLTIAPDSDNKLITAFHKKLALLVKNCFNPLHGWIMFLLKS